MHYSNSSSLLKAEMAQQQVKTREKAQSKNNYLNIQHILKQQKPANLSNSFCSAFNRPGQTCPVCRSNKHSSQQILH